MTVVGWSTLGLFLIGALVSIFAGWILRPTWLTQRRVWSLLVGVLVAGLILTVVVGLGDRPRPANDTAARQNAGPATPSDAAPTDLSPPVTAPPSGARSAPASPTANSPTGPKQPAAPSTRTTDVPAPTVYWHHVYHTCSNGACGLWLHTGPGYVSYPRSRLLYDSDAVGIVCQTRGDSVSGKDGSSSDVWDRLVEGDYAADFYVDTPGTTGSFSPPIPTC